MGGVVDVVTSLWLWFDWRLLTFIIIICIFVVYVVLYIPSCINKKMQWVACCGVKMMC